MIPVQSTASKYPDIAAVLKRGAAVNTPDPKGFTALMRAAKLGLVDNVETLLANSAEPQGEKRLEKRAFGLPTREN